MEALGAAASIISLVQAAKAILEIARRLRCNPRNLQQKKERLQEMVNHLIQRLEDAGSVSDANYAKHELEELKAMFESMEKRPCPQCLINCFWSCATSPSVNAKLEEAEDKLRTLRTGVLATVLIARQPVICNDTVEFPPSQVGLDRAQVASKFLKESEKEELRVIGIHGQPGLGKTTILNVLWKEASLEAPFAKRAYVQVGHDATEQSLRNLQSDILQQLGGEKKEFPSVEFGKGELSKHFLEMKRNKKPMFLAIDNLWDQEHLEKLLPWQLSTKEFLPTSSCITVSCRDAELVKALLRFCHLQECNGLQSLVFTPSFLSDEHAKTLFAETACMHDVAGHEELLNALVPLCGGLPFALTLLAKVFVEESKRERREWEAILMQMKDDDKELFGPVLKALNLSFQQLSEDYKAGFLDVVSFFYGWPWDTVERIVGARVLKRLENVALISKVEDYTQCNQSALRVGYHGHASYKSTFGTRLHICTQFLFRDYFPVSKKAIAMHDLALTFGERHYSQYFWEDYFPVSKKAIAMHDLSLTFGERLDSQYFFQKDISLQEFENIDKLENCSGLKAVRLRNLVLTRAGKHPVGVYVDFLRRATNLQMLILESDEGRDSTLLQAGYDHSESARACRLRYLRLSSWNPSTPVMEMMLSSEIREIHLHGCHDIVHLPDIQFQKLEILTIDWCANFQGFSKSCFQGCSCLKELAVVGCKSFTEVPAELGRLPSLKSVCFRSCKALQQFPSLCNPDGPYHVRLQDCPRLQTLPNMSCPLRSLELGSVPISGLNDMEERAWAFLQELSLQGCRALEALPASIGNATLLQVLELDGCDQLKQLPDEIGKLQSLRVLHITMCRALQSLPAAIGDTLVALQELEVQNCGDKLEMPGEVGNLTSLTRLMGSCIGPAVNVERLGSLKDCTFLRKLPARGLSKLLQLEHLSIQDCDDLLELPEELGNLTSLRELQVWNCRSLQKLPESSISSSLVTITVSSCNRLERLPASVCNACHLQRLELAYCDSLLQLPARGVREAELLEKVVN